MRRAIRRGQSTAEYVIVVGVVIAAIVGMQIYVKRGLQAKVKIVTDNVGFGLKDAGFNANSIVSQYEPYYAESSLNVLQKSRINEAFQVGGKVSRTSVMEETNRTGITNQGVNVNKGDSWK